MPLVLRARSSDSEDDNVVFEIVGELDESAVFPKEKFRLSERLVFDCAHATQVSSFAALNWSRWMHSQDRRQQFAFRNVPPRIIDLFNQIDGYLPLETTVESFYAPYECSVCGHEELYLARRGRDYLEGQGKRAPQLQLPKEINCPKCKNGMFLGVWEEKFLKFLNREDKE